MSQLLQSIFEVQESRGEGKGEKVKERKRKIWASLKDRGIQKEKKEIERVTKREGESMRKKENAIVSQRKGEGMRKKERRNCGRERI